jgi:hypothetical protein
MNERGAYRGLMPDFDAARGRAGQLPSPIPADTDSHGRMDHPKAELTSNG